MRLLERSREDTHYIIVLRDSWESLTLLGMEVSLLVEMGSQQMDLGRNNAKVTNICTWRKPWELDLNGATKKWIHVCNLQWVQYMGFSMKQCKYKTMEVIMLHSINSNIILFTHIWGEGILNADVRWHILSTQKETLGTNWIFRMNWRSAWILWRVTWPAWSSPPSTTFWATPRVLAARKSPARQLGGIFNRSLYFYGKKSPCWEVFWSC